MVGNALSYLIHVWEKIVSEDSEVLFMQIKLFHNERGERDRDRQTECLGWLRKVSTMT